KNSVAWGEHLTTILFCVPSSPFSALTKRTQIKGLHLFLYCSFGNLQDGQDWTFFSSNIFSSTKINPESLTQKLEVDTKSVISAKKEEKKLVPKKEKAKQRRERWLQKIDVLALAQQAKKAQAKRKATPVVGDMRPLVDALPELSELTAVRKPRAPRKQPKCSVKKKPEPTDYSKMRPAQKRKIIEEEVSRVQELIRNPSYKANPLAAVGQHLLKRMKDEQETDPR
uniref:Family with sequence similarity 207 member A n=1 Tax=Xenopus tropicalis TaxID=8364 RepID=A0A803J368_XENTR